MKEKILISACLLGVPCRYDGKSKPCEALESLCEKYEWVPVCPEVLGGLPTPRLPCEIASDRVIRSDGADCTEPYRNGAKAALQIALDSGCKKAILKEKSPSCGKKSRYDGTFSKKLIFQSGITAKLLTEHNIEVFSEDELDSL